MAARLILGGLSSMCAVTHGLTLQTQPTSEQDARGEYDDLWWGTDQIQISSLPTVGGIDFCRDAVNATAVKPPAVASSYLARKGLSFSIGIIRNPYNYYVNLWKRLREGLAGAYDASLLAEYNQVESQSPDEPEHAKFGYWLRKVSNERLGLLSWRFFGTYVNGQTVGKDRTLFTTDSRDWAMNTVDTALQAISDGVEPQNSSAPAAEIEFAPLAPMLDPEDVGQAILDTFQEYAPSVRGPIDCFVYAESISMDMRHCLERYEHEILMKDGHFDTVQWANFDRLVQEKGWFLGSSKMECEAYYDADLRAFVAASDHTLLKFFNYENGCSGD